MGFLHISREVEIHAIPKTWEKWILIKRETYGKTQTFQSSRFLKYFAWNRNPCNSQSMGWLNSHITGKVFGKINIPKLWVPKYFTWSRNPYYFQTMGWVNSHITEQVWENIVNSQVLLYLTDLDLVETHAIPNVYVQIPIIWKYSAESHIIPRLWVSVDVRS